VPEALAAIVEKMMAKEAGQRYQTPQAVVDVLAPWTQAPIGPPPEDEMPRLCAAAMGVPGTESNMTPPGGPPAAPAADGSRKAWQVSAPGSKPELSPTIVQSGSGSKNRAATPPRPRVPATPVPMASSPASPAPRGAAALRAAQGNASNGKAPAPRSKAVPDDESVAWEQLTPDTADAKAKGDTDPNPAARSSSRARLAAVATQSARDRRRLFWVIGIVSGVMILGVIIALIVALVSGNSDPNKGGPPPSTGPKTLQVSRAGADGTFRWLSQALNQAKSGDRIVVLDGPIEEPLLIAIRGSKRLQDVTLEAAEGAEVVWKLPANSAEANQIVTLATLQNFVLRGFTFDGGGKVNDLIVLTDDCSGLALEKLKLKGFKRSGILLANCKGSAGRPITISRLRVFSTNATDAALFFQINPGFEIRTNQHITVPDLHIEGPCTSPVIYGPGQTSDTSVVLPKGVTPKQL
jgi:hypothetical protein